MLLRSEAEGAKRDGGAGIGAPQEPWRAANITRHPLPFLLFFLWSIGGCCSSFPQRDDLRRRRADDETLPW